MNLTSGAIFLAAIALGGGLGTAHAAPDINDPAINGTYLATWNGEWSKTNDSFHDEAVVRSKWTIHTSCNTPITCSGTVTSDQGWTSKIVRVPGLWKVIRDLPNWETCADGTAATGRQVITFYPVGDNPLEPVDPNLNTFSGEDVTTGPSGACGQNNLLQIMTPFKLVPID
ncbi:MAG TPA: hypothetical protein VFB19_03015 [Mycobacterium sp.]|nr:hypothetical protein [Mycobacterium sp.]